MSKDITDFCNGRDRADAISFLTSSTSTVAPRSRPRITTHARPDGLPPIKTAATLFGENLKLPEALVDGLLHRGSTMVFGGGSKTNKTFCLMDLAVSVASGTNWWDMETKKGRVLYLDFELQPTFFVDRLNHIVKAKNVGMGVLEDIDVWNLRGFAADISDQIDEMLERMKAQPYALIIIDPIYKALGQRDENAAGDINSLMNEIDKMAVQTGAAVVIGHHFSKGNQAGKESMDRISGSGVFGRAPDAILILTKHEQEDVYTVEATLRNFKRKEPFCVEWEYPLMVPNDDLDPAKLKKAGASALKYTGDQLLESLGDQELSVKQWRESTQRKYPMSKRTFMDKKSDLLAAGKIEQGPLKSWRVASTADRPPGEVQGANGAIAPLHHE